jgi:Xaa-Pro aminopeptidase
LLSGLIAKLKIKKLGFERNDLSFGEYQKIAQKLTKIKLTPTENLVEDLRAQKEPKEIKNIEKAVQIADRCFSHLLEFLKPGLTEKEVADEIELFIRKQGAVDISFDPIVASGENSSLPHYIMSKSFRLKTNRLVLLDFGAKVEGYCSDMTRVISLGKATSEQKKIYQTVLAAQKKALEALLYYFRVLKSKAPKKIPARMVDKVTRDYLNRFKFKLIHGLGHGVGLTEHEAPRLGPTSKDILKEGMVFSIEPGVYLSKRYGIRIEDLVVMEKTGPRVLTQSTKEIIEI